MNTDDPESHLERCFDLMMDIATVMIATREHMQNEAANELPNDRDQETNATREEPAENQ